MAFKIGQWVRAIKPYQLPLRDGYPDVGAVGRVVYAVRDENHVQFLLHPEEQSWLMYDDELEAIDEP